MSKTPPCPECGSRKTGPWADMGLKQRRICKSCGVTYTVHYAGSPRRGLSSRRLYGRRLARRRW